ncbi:MAG: GFA family protein [Pseudomonadales bacterium]
MTSRTGGCLCGAIRYELKQDPSIAAICHCTHCQRQSGGLFSTNLMVGEADYAHRALHRPRRQRQSGLATFLRPLRVANHLSS